MSHSTTIRIDGKKLKSLLESTTGKTIYQIAIDSGYTKNVIANAVKNGLASSSVQNIARLYGISPESYQIKESEPPKVEESLRGQISIDDIEAIKREELKALIKETISEELEFCFNSLACNVEPRSGVTRFFLIKKEG